MALRVISLTSIPPRFPFIGATLESLLHQDADLVQLYIPEAYRRFPDWNKNLPSVPSGVNIRRCKIDYGPATKILPACQEYRDVDAQILFCDDDCVVPKGWATRLFNLQASRPDQAVAYFGRHSYLSSKPNIFSTQPFVCPLKYDFRYRSLRLIQKIFFSKLEPYHRPIYKSGFASVLFGVGGVVVRPTFFDKEAYNIPLESFFVDDIWLSAMLARKNISIYVPAFGVLPKASSCLSCEALASLTIESKNRMQLNRDASLYCQNKYGIW